MPVNFFRKYLQLEATGGVILLLAAVLALILANSPAGPYYQELLTTHLDIKFDGLNLSHSLLSWINEGLMTLFFLLVGLELKREFFAGELSDLSRVLLPAVAAIGGMIFPALIYLIFNYSHPIAVKGWAIPVATDIAFALGVLSLLGKRVPLELKMFLMALAIFDDIGAILIIAYFFSKNISITFLVAAIGIVIVLYILNRLRVKNLTPYVLLGIVLWFCVLNSGVHATISGILLAFLIPQKRGPYLEKALHPWVSFFVMPLFALANMGLSFHDVSLATLREAVPLGIILGLFVGKQLGVFSFSWLIIQTGWARLPNTIRWRELFGVGVICGVGFTMSLFLGTLAFQQENSSYLSEVRLGVLVGSVLSGVVGALILRQVLNKGVRP